MGIHRVRFGLFAAAVCSFASASQASAANWWYLGSNASGVHFADLDSLGATLISGVAYTQVKALTRNDSADEDGVRFSLVTLNFDCRNLSSALTYAGYQADNGVTVKESQVSPQDADIVDIQPDTAYGVVRVFACNAPQMKGRERISIDGWDFIRVPDVKGAARALRP